MKIAAAPSQADRNATSQNLIDIRRSDRPGGCEIQASARNGRGIALRRYRHAMRIIAEGPPVEPCAWRVIVSINRQRWRSWILPAVLRCRSEICTRGTYYLRSIDIFRFSAFLPRYIRTPLITHPAREKFIWLCEPSVSRLPLKLWATDPTRECAKNNCGSRMRKENIKKAQSKNEQFGRLASSIPRFVSYRSCRPAS